MTKNIFPFHKYDTVDEEWEVLPLPSPREPETDPRNKRFEQMIDDLFFKNGYKRQNVLTEIFDLDQP